LQIALKLKQQLEARGVTVVMTRTSNDVNITNSARAKIANNAHANLFVRVHCDGSTTSSVKGISTLYPASNQWTKPIAARSKTAAGIVQASLIHATGATNRGAVQRSDLTGFNWATVPSVLVEAGFLSNRAEDALLVTSAYQDKIALGMTEGVMAYLATGN
jgi:N-acetylmuramoyl-L-alanine amidase